MTAWQPSVRTKALSNAPAIRGNFTEKPRDNFSICCLVNQLQLSNQDNGCKMKCVQCVSGVKVSRCKSESEQSNSISP